MPLPAAFFTLLHFVSIRLSLICSSFSCFDYHFIFMPDAFPLSPALLRRGFRFLYEMRRFFRERF